MRGLLDLPGAPTNNMHAYECELVVKIFLNLEAINLFLLVPKNPYLYIPQLQAHMYTKLVINLLQISKRQATYLHITVIVI